jgi:hypothetical protein
MPGLPTEGRYQCPDGSCEKSELTDGIRGCCLRVEAGESRAPPIGRALGPRPPAAGRHAEQGCTSSICSAMARGQPLRHPQDDPGVRVHERDDACFPHLSLRELAALPGELAANELVHVLPGFAGDRLHKGQQHRTGQRTENEFGGSPSRTKTPDGGPGGRVGSGGMGLWSAGGRSVTLVMSPYQSAQCSTRLLLSLPRMRNCAENRSEEAAQGSVQSDS